MRWANAAVPRAAVRDVVPLFPWIPTLTVLKIPRTGIASIATAIAAGLIHFGPSAMLLLLVARHPIYPGVLLLGLVAVGSLFVVQLHTLRLIHSLTTSGADKAAFPSRWNDETNELVASHFERVDHSWSAAVSVSAAISTFFVAYLFVPQSLLGDRTALHDAHATRVAFQTVYDQRFREHRNTFADWCTARCNDYDSLLFLSENLPKDHPAYMIAESALKQAPLATYPFALSNIKDIVLESRANVAELDRADISDAVEVLYRENLDPLPEQIRSIKNALSQQPLDEATLKGVSRSSRRVIHPPPCFQRPIGTGLRKAASHTCSPSCPRRRR